MVIGDEPACAEPDPSAATTRAIGVATALPTPDPSLATIRFVKNDARSLHAFITAHSEIINARVTGLENTVNAKRDGLTAMVEQRLDAMDKATNLLAADLRQVPSDLQLAITTVKELASQKFAGIDSKFMDNERQTSREKAAADLALAAAFDAQKEASAAQNRANAARTDKSEATVNETIKNNAETQRTGSASLSDKIEDLKDRVVRSESLIIALQTQRLTSHESKGDNRTVITVGVGIAALFVAIVVAAVTIYAALKQGPA